MDRRAFLSGLVAGALASPLGAETVPRDRPARIGLLTLRPPGVDSPYTNALMEGLRERGYVEGRNLAIEYPDADGREDRLPELATLLVRKRVDVIVIIGPAPLAAARNTTKTIPLVMVASSADPVAEGIAESLARPGGNVTGFAYAEPDRFKKQLEQLKAVATRAARVAVLWDFDVEIYRRSWKASLTDAARVLGLEVLDPFLVTNAAELPAAFAAMKRQRADAALVSSGNFLFVARAQVAQLALEHRLPALAAFREFPQAGLLMSYGPDFLYINRRAADYVDKILRGGKPAELPIELPNKYELVVNARTAKALGLAVPQSVMMRANEVIQ